MSNIHRPGTVSKILWHFTGGREWNARSKKYSDTLKPIEKAYLNLISILESKTLKVGSFREQISVAGAAIETKRVCCVADIPIAHLHYHSKNYGKIALGFNRRTLIQNRFNPVFYVKEDKPTVLRFHGALSSLQELDFSTQEFLALLLQNEEGIDQALTKSLLEGISNLKKKVSESAQNLKLMQSFIKTLKDEEDFDGVFCEREWRNDVNFNFSYEDISMIILPKNDEINYFHKFIDNEVPRLKIPRQIPIISWEDLIEH